MQELHEEVDRYIAGWDVGAAPAFLSMHLRRTDFTSAHKATYAETDEVTATLARLAAKHDVNHGKIFWLLAGLGL
jgi:hypothetical protein